ncbi:sensor histidine kinase [Halostagnicola kamekurae]|uniref:histidine kinase n=1 Tax=Halostagnicola kamekurae TaxID=619731 RepID=A0A1I6TSX4_9EURY|nr:HAMP domain-containing sensor histidine kinase [Halostagnicola kamekurae]SFS92312.1 His Kinase A (phospho-acceptor) domain-containing protein [Halostagnicola kamekurae]
MLNAVPEPVVGYTVVDGTPQIAATNDAFDATFDAASTGTILREWLLRNHAVDEAAIEEVCSALAEGDAIDAEIRVRPAGSSANERRPVRLRSFDGDATDGTVGSDTVDGHVLVTKMKPTDTDSSGLDHVASVITHDLRNPLDVANAHLLAARETGEDEHFEQVRDAHDRMERIIQDALTLARGERAIDVSQSVTISDVASNAWETVDTGAASLDVDDDLSPINADADRLQRLFENLFRNAVEHSSTSPGSQTRQDDAQHSHSSPSAEAGLDLDESVRILVGSLDGGFFVADDGPGIAPDERERVFDPGYSSAEAGTGLGLTIVERIARAHDWTVSITEGSSGGARFEFRPVTDE